MSSTDFADPVELEVKLGHRFADRSLLDGALTHPSMKHGNDQQNSADYQRLEFLGDSVIQLVVAEELFSTFPDQPEGILTKIRAQLVSRRGLASYAHDLDLSRFVRTAASVKQTEGAHRDALLEDTFEAVIGAIYLDAGMHPARTLVLQLVRPRIQGAAEEPDGNNPKGSLQEQLQRVSPQAPQYRILSQSGPPHDMRFEAGVFWKKKALGSGIGASKQAAESAAAQDALRSDGLRDILADE